MRVPSLGWEEPLEEGMATHSSLLARRIPWTEEPGGYSPWGCRVRSDLPRTYISEQNKEAHLRGTRTLVKGDK